MVAAEISRAGRAFFAVKKLHQPTTTSTLNGQTKRESKKTTGKEPNKNTSRNLKGGVRFQSSSFCLRNWTLQLVLERKKEKNKTPLDTLARLRFEFYDTVDILQFCRTPVYVPNQLGHGLSSREGPGHHTRHRATVQACAIACCGKYLGRFFGARPVASPQGVAEQYQQYHPRTTCFRAQILFVPDPPSLSSNSIRKSPRSSQFV